MCLVRRGVCWHMASVTAETPSHAQAQRHGRPRGGPAGRPHGPRPATTTARGPSGGRSRQRGRAAVTLSREPVSDRVQCWALEAALPWFREGACSLKHGMAVCIKEFKPLFLPIPCSSVKQSISFISSRV